MKTQELFCSACDRAVRVMITDAPSMEGEATLHDDEVICLELGTQCTGTLCPIGAAAPNAMLGRLIRNGLPLDGLHTVRSLCPSCGLETEMALYGDGRAACTVCGSPARWTVDHAEPM